MKSLFKGWFGELKTTFNMWFALDAEIYHRFHGLIIPSKNGTTQIDHLIVSEFGVFIIETKNKNGWIFGSEHQPIWTQVLFDRKYSFQNPLRQTFRQKKILCEFLELDESKVRTIVFFVGDSQFKTPMPENVMDSGLGDYIGRFDSQCLSPEAVNRLVFKLEDLQDESDLTMRDHRHSLDDRHASTTRCPKCGSKLVERTVKRGPHVGTSFLGCQAYPKCRFTRS